MSYEISCNLTNSNTGAPRCNADIGRVIFSILVPRGTEIADEATAKLEATWTDILNATSSTRGYPLKKYFEYLPEKEDTVYEDGDDGQRFAARDGYQWGTIATYKRLHPCYLHKLRSLNDQDWAKYDVTNKGYILGHSTDGTKFLPTNNFYRCEGEAEAPRDESRMTTVRIYNEDTNDWDDYGVAVKPTAFDPRDLVGLYDVDITVVTEASDSIVVDVITDCDLIGVSGLVVTDFVKYDAVPAEEAITSATESTSVAGRYTLVPTTTFATGTVDLRAPADQTTQGYESTGAAAVTI